MEIKGNVVGIFLTGFIVILLGIIFTSTIGDQSAANTQLSSMVNESVTLTSSVSTVVNETITASGGTAQLVGTGIQSITYFGNVTNSTDLAGITIGDEINYSRSGGLRIAQGTVFPGAGSYNVTYTKDNNVTGTTANANVVSVTFFGDANASTHHSTIVLGEQVNFTKSTGVLKLASANFTNRAYNASYTYEGANYVVDKLSRTILNLNTLWFALFVLAAALVLVLRAYPELFNF